MEFKALEQGAIFEFDHVGLAFHRDLCHGPWRKVSSRTYSPCQRGGGAWITGPQRIRVGSVKVKVRVGESCGGGEL